jgi:hypothetical protein
MESGNNVSMEIVPNVGIGHLCFGDTYDTIVKKIGLPHSAFKKSPFSDEFAIDYRMIGLHIYLDVDRKADFFECFTPSVPTYAGEVLIKRNSSDILTRFTNMGCAVRQQSDALFFDDLGIALYAPAGEVEGVSVYPRGYYERIRSRPELT